MTFSGVIAKDLPLSTDMYISAGTSYLGKSENDFFVLSLKVNIKQGPEVIVQDADLCIPAELFYDLAGVITKEMLMTYLLTQPVNQMRFKEVEVNQFVDMVGYIKNQPLDIFRIKHADERRLVVGTYDEVLIELKNEKE